MSQSQLSAPGSSVNDRDLRQHLPVLPQRSFGQTSRKDNWWLTPLVVFLGLGGFIVYSTWAAFQGKNYWYEGYLSPMYSPEIWGPSPHSWLGTMPKWLPSFMTPALLILWAPGLFRFTCYYYRGAYYKAFWADPISCAVGEPRKTYWGEKTLPLILQNAHRYFLYLALLFLFLLAHDVWKGMWFHGTDGREHFGIGVGTFVLAINVCLLSFYTLGCHSLRHLVGGIKDVISKSPARHKAYQCVSCFNRRHMLWAWCSLIWVAFTDIYIRLCSMGIWHDLHWSTH